mgnify:CR=1 FL=1
MSLLTSDMEEVVVLLAGVVWSVVVGWDEGERGGGELDGEVLVNEVLEEGEGDVLDEELEDDDRDELEEDEEVDMLDEEL